MCSETKHTAAVPVDTHAHPHAFDQYVRDLIKYPAACSPSPHTIAPTSAPRPGTIASSTRCSATLSQYSFIIFTFRCASRSSVWNAPILTCLFSAATCPEIERLAVGIVGPLVGWAASAPAAEVLEDENSSLVTRRVRCRWTRSEEVDPVAVTDCTRLGRVSGLCCMRRRSERTERLLHGLHRPEIHCLGWIYQRTRKMPTS